MSVRRVPRQLAYFSRHGDTSEMLAQMARVRYLVPDSVVSDEALVAAIQVRGRLVGLRVGSPAVRDLIGLVFNARPLPAGSSQGEPAEAAPPSLAPASRAFPRTKWPRQSASSDTAQLVPCHSLMLVELPPALTPVVKCVCLQAGGYGSAEDAVAAGLAEARYRAGGRRHSEGQHSPRGRAPDGLACSPGGVPLHALSARDYHRLLASSGKNGFRSKTVDVMWLPTHTTGGPVIGRHMFPQASQWKVRALRQDSPYGKPICTRLQ